MLGVSAALRDSDAVAKSARRLTGFDVDVDATEDARVTVTAPAGTVVGKTVWKAVAAPSTSAAGILRARRALAMKVEALAALNGAGPALAEQDLIGVIDAIGAAPTPGVKERLAKWAKDPRPTVAKIAVRSEADLADPTSRNKRIVSEREPQATRQRDDGREDDHGHAHAPLPPGPPAP